MHFQFEDDMLPKNMMMELISGNQVQKHRLRSFKTNEKNMNFYGI